MAHRPLLQTPTTLLLALTVLLPAALDAQSGTWTQRADFGGGTREGAVAFSIGTKGYVGTGQSGAARKKDFWEYDPAADAWTQKADFGGTARRYATGFSIGNMGYIGAGNATDGRKKDFWQYDPLANTWTQKADCGGPERVFPVGFSIGNKGYVGTGFNQYDEDVKDFWEYDPATNTWTQKADFGGTARDGAVGFSIGDKGYVGTGFDFEDVTSDFWQYDPGTNTWTQKAGFAGSPRYNATGFSVGGMGYIGTGDGGAGLLDDLWAYNPATDSWSAMPAFGGGLRQRAAAFTIGTKAYMGIGSRTAAMQDLWEYHVQPAITCSANTGPFCADGTTGPTLSFQVEEAFQAGNIFTAQLSNAIGSFANPLAIGSVQGTTGGVINCSIPANQPSGTGYRIRVVGSSPARIGSDNGADISVMEGVPVAPAISAAGPVEFCDGGSVTLSVATTSGSAYLWFRNGAALGETGASLAVEADGTYAVQVSNGCGQAMSDGIAVTVHPAPVHVLPQTAFVVCNGQSVTINANNQSGLTSLEYQWVRNGSIMAGENGPSISTTAPGAYALEISDPQTGCWYLTPEATVSMGLAPGVQVAANGPTTICHGDTVLLEATSNMAQATFAWYLDGVLLPGDDLHGYPAITGGQYTAVAAMDGCSSAPSAPVDVVVNPLPPVPVITQDGNTLEASGAGEHQWFQGGSPVPGASGQFFLPPGNGLYSVSLTDGNGCTSTSGPYAYISTGISLPDAEKTDVWPNPSEGLFLVSLPVATGPDRSYTVFDDTGKSILQGRLSGATVTVDLSTWPAGVYVLKVISGEAAHVRRLVKR
ncbi:MAG TPA: kelch repeat-containing protein [Flavobacteriales bacterium]|nr:kelch repeat-containing protein [Flavobacteriales bacterium]